MKWVIWLLTVNNNICLKCEAWTASLNSVTFSSCWLISSASISLFKCQAGSSTALSPHGGKDSLGSLQNVRSVDAGPFSGINHGLVAHHNHPTFHGAQGREAATRDCGRRDMNPFYSIYFSVRHKQVLFMEISLQALLGISMAGHKPSFRISGGLWKGQNSTLMYPFKPAWMPQQPAHLPVWRSPHLPCSTACSIHGRLCCLPWPSPRWGAGQDNAPHTTGNQQQR